MFSLLLAALFSVGASVYTCTNNVVTVKYQGQPYYFPAQGSDDHYASFQNCSWLIQIPDGYYINWGFHANFKNDEGGTDFLYTLTMYGDQLVASTYYGKNWDYETAAMGDQLKMNLRTHNNTIGHFRFNVTWSKQVPPSQPLVTSVDSFGYSILDLKYMNSAQNVRTFAMVAPSKNLTLISTCVHDPDIVGNVWVYEGLSVAEPHKTLLDGDENNFVNNAYTLYNPIANSPLDKCLTMAMDVSLHDQFGSFDAFYDYPTTNQQIDLHYLDDSAKPSATTAFAADGNPVVVHRIVFQAVEAGEAASVYAYNGVPTPDNIDKPDIIFSPDNSTSALPYHFKQNVVTFVMKTKGEAYIHCRPELKEMTTKTNLVTTENGIVKTFDFDDGRRLVHKLIRQ